MKKLIDLTNIRHHEKCVYNKNTNSYLCHDVKKTMCKFKEARLKNAKINHINDTIQSIAFSYKTLKEWGISDSMAIHIILHDELNRKYQIMTNLGESAKVIKVICDSNIDKLIKLLEEMEV